MRSPLPFAPSACLVARLHIGERHAVDEFFRLIDTTAEFNSQEDTLTTLRRDLATLQTQRAAAQSDLDTRIASLQINETL